MCNDFSDIGTYQPKRTIDKTTKQIEPLEKLLSDWSCPTVIPCKHNYKVLKQDSNEYWFHCTKCLDIQYKVLK